MCVLLMKWPQIVYIFRNLLGKLYYMVCDWLFLKGKSHDESQPVVMSVLSSLSFVVAVHFPVLLQYGYHGVNGEPELRFAVEIVIGSHSVIGSDRLVGSDSIISSDNVIAESELRLRLTVRLW